MLWVIGIIALMLLLFFTAFNDQRKNKGRGGFASFLIACAVSGFTTAFFVVGGFIIYMIV